MTDPRPPARPVPPPPPNHAWLSLDASILISHLLRVGVTASAALVAFGLVLTFVHHPDYLTSRAALTALLSPAALPNTMGEVARSCLADRGQAFVLLGILVLVATPVVRVALSIVIFLEERDRVFATITAVVLGVLLLSFVLGAADTRPAPSAPPPPAASGPPPPPAPAPPP